MALITATIAVVVMMALGLATVAFVGGQRNFATGERHRESAFNLAEAVLNSEIFVVSKNWPASSGSSYPSRCTSTSSVRNCPDPAIIAAQFTGPDYVNSSWNVTLQDNGGANADYYSTTAAASQPTYDANGDGKIWVKAQAVARGKTRTLVGQVKTDVRTISFPPNVLTAGYFSTTSNGNKVFVDTSGRSYSSNPGNPGTLAVRCNTPPKSPCLNYEASKGQVSPPAVERNYPTARLTTSEDLEALRSAAKSLGTYTGNGCPSSLVGSLVFIENGNCGYNGGTYNSLTAPGMVVVATGTLSLGGNFRYYGLVYAANLQNSTGFVISMNGCPKVIGGVAVDGPGGVSVGSCGDNIAFNGNVFGLAKVAGDPTSAKGTWREVSG